MELLLGLFVVTYWVCSVPRAVADAVATWRASAAGNFDFIDRERERRASRRERYAKAWGDLRARRHQAIGGTGEYRPGALAYMGDVYHGFWERALEKRTAKRAARGPYVYDPDAPTLRDRLHEAMAGKVDRLRQVRLRQVRLPEPVVRAGSALWEPVGSARPAPPGSDDEVGPVLAPRLDPDVDRVCPTCGARMVAREDGWHHPDGSTCPEVEWDGVHFDGEGSTVHDPKPLTEEEKQHEERLREKLRSSRVLDEFMARRGLSRLRGEQDEVVCGDCGRTTTWAKSVDDGQGGHLCIPCEFKRMRGDQADNNDTNGTDQIDRTDSTTTEGDTTMNTATGETHDVETCKNQCLLLEDDLTRIDTSLDVIDEAIRSAATATEHIEAWLKSKNFDDTTVGGMRAALDMLNADRMKELMDAVAAAKQGVKATLDGLAPYEEAADLIGQTDGSAINGR